MQLEELYVFKFLLCIFQFSMLLQCIPDKSDDTASQINELKNFKENKKRTSFRSKFVLNNNGYNRQKFLILNFTMHFLILQSYSNGFLGSLTLMIPKLMPYKSVRKPGRALHLEAALSRTTTDTIEKIKNLWFYNAFFNSSKLRQRISREFDANDSQINAIQKCKITRKSSSFRSNFVTDSNRYNQEN